MLKEIVCDKFISNGKPRGPIRFFPGLNAVTGNESGTNSVGKSTFLMILDFVFGGTDYLTKSKEVHKENNAGLHTICFTFVFDGKEYHFRRSTNPSESNMVFVCDDKYEDIPGEEMSLEKYNGFLREKYKLTGEGQSWRSSVSRFIRVDRRDTLDTEKPLRESRHDSDEKSITDLLRIYEKYHIVAEQIRKQNNADAEEKAFKDAQKYEYIPNISGITEYRKNQSRIETLEIELEDLAQKSSEGLLELSAIQAEQIRIIKNKLASFRRQRTMLRTQRDSILQSKNEKNRGFTSNYYELQHFFPNIEISKLAEVEEFHRNMAKVLDGEIRESVRNLEALIGICEGQIEELENEQTRISQIPNVSRAALEQYADIQNELMTLKAANEAYRKRNELHANAVELREQVGKTIVDEARPIAQDLNTRMDGMNEGLYNESIKPPVLLIESPNSYSFYTDDDRGTGSRSKGVILLDLAILNSSNLPLVVHDSVLFANISNEVIEKILELYVKQKDKQIFIAIDKATPKAKELLAGKTVLHLTRDGNELFGRPWNKKEENDEQVTSVDGEAEHHRGGIEDGGKE